MGGIRPDRPDELGPDEEMGDWGGGAIIAGTKGKMMCSTYGNNPQLLPTKLTMEEKTPQTIARVPEGHYVQWVDAALRLR
jgi:hypothetical protein